MDEVVRRVPLPIAGFAASAAVAVLIPLLILWPARLVPDAAPPLKVTAFALPVPPTSDTILAAPLFSPERKPAASGDEAAAEVLPLPALTGIIRKGKSAGLVLVRNAAGETISVRVGDIIDGWRLVEFDDTRAVFEQNGEQQTASLDFRNKDVPAPAPGGAPKNE